MLRCIDVLVDGPFVQEQKSLMLKFKGSANQRVIDMNFTRESGEIVIWAGCKEDKVYESKN